MDVFASPNFFVIFLSTSMPSAMLPARSFGIEDADDMRMAVAPAPESLGFLAPLLDGPG